jgi:hypothetical protein
LRENKRTINRAIREIDREKTNLERQEKKLIGEIKKNAKANQMGAVKVRCLTFPTNTLARNAHSPMKICRCLQKISSGQEITSLNSSSFGAICKVLLSNWRWFAVMKLWHLPWGMLPRQWLPSISRYGARCLCGYPFSTRAPAHIKLCNRR